VAERHAGEQPLAEQPDSEDGKFDRDTAVWLDDGPDGSPDAGDGGEDGAGRRLRFGAVVAPDWRAGRGPHGGYLAAMLLRALLDAVADTTRAPRSLTIHYARAPEPGPVQITTTLERDGRSLSTLSARMHQDGQLIALALAAFSVPWGGPEISDVQMPVVEPADPSRDGVKLIKRGGPEFAHHIVLQPRMPGVPLSGEEQPMEILSWIGLAAPRPLDALALAFYSDALIPAPYMRVREPVAVPTVDLTVHFHTHDAQRHVPDPGALCLARTSTELVHEGFFVEDGTIWAPDGTLLAKSRQLAIVIPFAERS
jgi:acyl-CoA thioesterase